LADKIQRALDLAKIISDAEAELAQLVGAEPRRRGRPPKQQNGDAEQQTSMLQQ
jgi:hypothetical protein